MATHDVAARRRRPKDPIAPKIPAMLTDADSSNFMLDDDGIHLSMRYGPLDLSSTIAENLEFERCRFSETNLSRSALRRATLTDVELKGCDLANLRATNSSLFTTAVDRCRLTGVQLSECGFRDVLFTECRADLSSFRFGRFRNVVFRACNLTEANFQGADLTGVRFEGCALVAAQFSGATMKGTRLTDCDLAGVAGVQSFEGAIVSAADAQGLVYALASAMGITIED